MHNKKRNGDDFIIKGLVKKRMFVSLLIVIGLVLLGVSYWNLSPVPKAYMYGKALTKITHTEYIYYI